MTTPLPYRSGTIPKPSAESGFTLLELLLVLAIMSSVAWMSLALVGNGADQARFEETRNRLQTIRRAIIGDASRTLNGGPEISGYVADMGNLPANLQALAAREYCLDRPDLTTQAACSAGGGSWTTQPAYSFNTVYGLWAGWNGPYLRPTELTDYPRFSDGWGNRDDSSSNFGWRFESYTGGGTRQLRVQSRGRDGVWDPASTDPFESDYPPAATPLIAGNEYRIKITESGTAAQGDAVGGLQVDFVASEKLTSGGQSLCLALVYRSGGVLATLASSAVEVTWNGTRRIEEFVFEGAGPPFDADTFLYLGQAAYGVFEFDGACNLEKPFPAGSAPWTGFSCVPGRALPPFERKVGA